MIDGGTLSSEQPVNCSIYTLLRVLSFQAGDLNSKLKEDKSSSALKKNQVNKTGGKTPAQSSRPTVPPTTKRPLKPQQSAPARTQSLKTKKEANSDTSPVKSSGLQQKKVKPDTIAAHKNPTR